MPGTDIAYGATSMRIDAVQPTGCDGTLSPYACATRCPVLTRGCVSSYACATRCLILTLGCAYRPTRMYGTEPRLCCYQARPATPPKVNSAMLLRACYARATRCPALTYCVCAYQPKRI
eukprot:3769884-Rhodomonas_salina.1